MCSFFWSLCSKNSFFFLNKDVTFRHYKNVFTLLYINAPSFIKYRRKIKKFVVYSYFYQTPFQRFYFLVWFNKRWFCEALFETAHGHQNTNHLIWPQLYSSVQFWQTWTPSKGFIQIFLGWEHSPQLIDATTSLKLIWKLLFFFILNIKTKTIECFFFSFNDVNEK